VLYHFLKAEGWERVLIFVNRRATAERLTNALRRHDIEAELISGALPQHKRTRVLEDFRAGRVRVLVATDVAGRGLHIEGVSHVVNYNVPTDPEDYIHRIGRTGRAGASGVSITFACEEESFYLPPIEELMGKPIRCVLPDDEWLTPPPEVRTGAVTEKKDPRARKRSGRSSAGRGRGERASR
jgi:ATP-dependent RNA helicase RhlB